MKTTLWVSFNDWQTYSYTSFYFTGQKENVTKLFRSFKAAWDQVRLHLSSQGDNISKICSLLMWHSCDFNNVEIPEISQGLESI